MDDHAKFENTTRITDLLGGGSFITSQHPNFDISLHKVLDTAFYIILEQIFNSSYSHKLVLVFNFTGNYLFVGHSSNFNLNLILI